MEGVVGNPTIKDILQTGKVPWVTQNALAFHIYLCSKLLLSLSDSGKGGRGGTAGALKSVQAGSSCPSAICIFYLAGFLVFA